MKIAVASGKGGTGKTSVAVNLAISTHANKLLDCDVEEPNTHLFFELKDEVTRPVEVLIPEIDEKKCTYCGECSRFCQYHALFITDSTAQVFDELCHSCGGCKIVCPYKAIEEKPMRIGYIHEASVDDFELVYGELDIGRPLAIPVIKEVKKKSAKEGLTLLDSPPGTACPVVETVDGCDFCLLVTEPTPFGLHDLEITVDVVKQLKVPLGVVVNFAGVGGKGVYEFCNRENIPILMEIPYDENIAKLYSMGIPFSRELKEWMPRFQSLLEKIEDITIEANSDS